MADGSHTPMWVFLMVLVLVFQTFGYGGAARLDRWESLIRMPTDQDDDELGTQWAVLVAGSSGFGNYRHQVKKKKKRKEFSFIDVKSKLTIGSLIFW